jgi:hypothetical protein
VVPLEDLVENYAVDEPPEADANEDSRRPRPREGVGVPVGH